jgi:ABC-type nitrate/sulfonate/bicarbonate transport system permease component
MSIRRWRKAKTKNKAARGSLSPVHGLLPLVLFLLLWQLMGSSDSAYLPKPSSWVGAIRSLWAEGTLGQAMQVTAVAFCWGLLISFVLGTVLGVALGWSKRTDKALGPILEFGRTMPAGAIVPVAVLIIGYTVPMKLSVVVLTAVWPIMLNARSGVRNVDPERLDTGRTLGLGRLQTFRKLLIPSVVPDVLLGVQIAAPIVLIIVLLVEILTQVSGVGREIAIAQSTYHSATVFGLVVLTGFFGLVVNWFISLLGRVIRKYDPSATQRADATAAVRG